MSWQKVIDNLQKAIEIAKTSPTDDTTEMLKQLGKVTDSIGEIIDEETEKIKQEIKQIEFQQMISETQ